MVTENTSEGYRPAATNEESKLVSMSYRNFPKV